MQSICLVPGDVPDVQRRKLRPSVSSNESEDQHHPISTTDRTMGRALHIHCPENLSEGVQKKRVFLAWLASRFPGNSPHQKVNLWVLSWFREALHFVSLIDGGKPHPKSCYGVELLRIRIDHLGGPGQVQRNDNRLSRERPMPIRRAPGVEGCPLGRPPSPGIWGECCRLETPHVREPICQNDERVSGLALVFNTRERRRSLPPLRQFVCRIHLSRAPFRIAPVEVDRRREREATDWGLRAHGSKVVSRMSSEAKKRNAAPTRCAGILPARA